MSLLLGPGISVTSASYSITGPNAFSRSGTVAVGSNSNVPVTLNDVPAGSGYVITLSATASDGITQCSGSGTFDVLDSASSTVIVHLVCQQGATGAAAVDGTINLCPLVDGLGASPADSFVGGTISLDALAHDADNGPSPLTYSWTVNGTNVPGSGPHYDFICASAGAFDVAVIAADGDPDPTCPSQISVHVTCTAP